MSDIVPKLVQHWRQDRLTGETFDEVASEEPLEIRVGGRPVSVTMRTPGHDLELAAGFLLSEGLLEGRASPALRHEHPNVVNAAANGFSEAALARLTRHFFVASSCGICGKAAIEAIHQDFPAVDDDVRVPRTELHGLLNQLNVAQPGFTRTGGVHAAALFDRSGALVVAREDVGRHNAVDKVIGYALARKLIPLAGHLLLVSGRVSFEIVQKALAARIPVVAAVSAPSSLAVEFARQSGQTLVGFLRPGRFNVYAHPERIIS